MISNPFPRWQADHPPSTTERLRSQLRPWQDELTVTAGRWARQLGELVGRYPGGAMAVAFSLGVGLGWMIKRRM